MLLGRRNDTMTRIVLRGIRALAVAVLSVWLVYVLVVNTFLGTPIGRHVLHVEPELEVRYVRAWSLLPGRVHAQGLSIRSSDTSVEWILRVDEVRFDVSFTALARRCFSADEVVGHGITFRGRRKLLAEPTGAPPALPPIDGLPPWSVKRAGPPGPAHWDDARHRLWTIALERVAGQDVREIWFDELRFDGLARVDGRFRIVPLRAVEVGPARFMVERGRLGLGDAAPFATVQGSGELTIARFDPRTDDPLRAASGKARLDATFVAVPHVDVTGRAAVALDVEVARGVLARSHATFEVPAATVRHEGMTVTGHARGEVSVAERLVGDVALSEVIVTRGGEVRAPSIHVDVEAARLDLAGGPLADLRANVVVPHAAVRALPARGVVASVALKTRVERRDDEVVLDGAHLALRDAHIGGVRSWSATLDAPRARLKLAPPSLAASVHLRAADARPALRGLPDIVAKLVEMPGLRASARLHVGANGFAVQDLRARGGDVAVRGDYAGLENDPDGAFVVEKGPIAVGIHLDKDGARPRIDDLDPWLRERARAIDAKAKRVR